MKDLFEIHPHIGVADIRFGESVETAFGLFGKPNSVVKDRFSPDTAFYFRESAIMIDTDDGSTICAIEFYRPIAPVFEGNCFLGRPFSEVHNWFELRDDQLEFDGASLISRKFGVAVFAPSAEKAPEEPVTAIIAFKRGYYERNS